MDIITLIDELVTGLLKGAEDFYSSPKDFYSFESYVKTTTDATAAKFMSGILSDMDKTIADSTWRKNRYNIERKDHRTLVSSVGDISFDCTYFKRVDGLSGDKYSYLLEDILGLSDKERFTEAAEVAILTEALKTSYEEATKVIPCKTKITKTTVMNKIHGISDVIPYIPPVEKKQCKYLFIEADEDHVAEQHGRWNDKVLNKSFIARLVYIYEYKQESSACKGRKELVNKFYFGGLYSGKNELKKLWEEVQQYINTTFDTDTLKRVYISGDGAPWIKTGTTYIDKALFCADKFHLVKYINKASG